MAKITLGSRPKSFPRVVKFTDVDGTELTAPVTYKYRTRKEFGEWLDTLPAYPQTKDGMVGEGENSKFSSEAYIEKVSAWNANKIMQILEGWALDEEFSAANVRQLCDEMPACAEAIIENYRSAIIEGRLGN